MKNKIFSFLYSSFISSYLIKNQSLLFLKLYLILFCILFFYIETTVCSSREWCATLDDDEVDPDQLDFFLEAFEAWRREMGIERMHLLGHSWGGYLSTRYTQR